MHCHWTVVGNESQPPGSSAAVRSAPDCTAWRLNHKVFLPSFLQMENRKNNISTYLCKSNSSVIISEVCVSVCLHLFFSFCIVKQSRWSWSQTANEDQLAQIKTANTYAPSDANAPVRKRDVRAFICWFECMSCYFSVPVLSCEARKVPYPQSWN